MYNNFLLNKPKNKRAEIGETLTWMTGFLLIFFVIIIFISGTLILAATKSVSGDKEEIRLGEYNSKSIEIQRILFSILNSEVSFNEKQIKIKELIQEADLNNKNEIGNLLKKETEEILGNLGECDYAMVINYISDDSEQSIQFGTGKILNSGAEFVLFSESRKIKIKFSLGECV